MFASDEADAALALADALVLDALVEALDELAPDEQPTSSCGKYCQILHFLHMVSFPQSLLSLYRDKALGEVYHSKRII